MSEYQELFTFLTVVFAFFILVISFLNNYIPSRISTCILYKGYLFSL